MRKILIAASIVLALTATSGCTDAERANLFAYGDEATVTCYSGGVEIFKDTSTGKVQPLEGDGFVFKSKTRGKLVRSFADCILIVD